MHGAAPNRIFSPADLEAIHRRGMAPEAAARQIERLRQGSIPIAVERPATLSDGIESAAGHEDEWDRLGLDAVANGRASGFVPASGAATRMFQELIQAYEERLASTPPGSSAAVDRFLDDLPRLALSDALTRTLAVRGFELERLRAERQFFPILDALLGPTGLDYGRKPKAMVPFHRDADGVRTAIDEHLEDAAAAMADGDRSCRIHFTVPPEHRGAIDARARARCAEIERRSGVHVRIELSSQYPVTDCLAVTPDGQPLRDEEGSLVFRPGGHGALLANLAASGGDLVLLKNIDNVTTTPHKSVTYRWVPRLLGCLAAMERTALGLIDRLEDLGDAGATSDAERFLAEALGHRDDRGHGDRREHLRARLDRPMRVCGMVPNAGEPGGGPFWVRDADGALRLQIVEITQIEAASRGLLARATHFNPVFMACALRDRSGHTRPLERFADPDAAIVTRKSAGARELLAYEHPGLWNGSMAKWNTVFVEVPAALFTPVKTVFDLLRPEHQPVASSSPTR